MAGSGYAEAAALPLPCDQQTAEVCQITGLKDLGAGGTYHVDRDLHIMGAPAEIRTDAGSSLTLEIDGDLVVNPGGKITGNTANQKGRGAAITITVAGQVLLAGDATQGAQITVDQTSNSCNDSAGAGSITITSAATGPGPAIEIQAGARVTASAACLAGTVDIEAPQGTIIVAGLVESFGKRCGGTAGGPISIVAGCDLTVVDTGRVSSRGGKGGGDLVRLVGGCDVTIAGLIESTGPAREPSRDALSRCRGPLRPDKPADSDACIEVLAGESLLIDGTGANHGEVQANLASTNGKRIAWIDLFAGGPVTIKGAGAGPYAPGASGYAVQANQTSPNSRGGIVTVKSMSDSVTLAGQAIQADGGLSKATGKATQNSRGGTVTIEAGGTGHVDLGSASVRARGGTLGKASAGGLIAVRSWNAKVLGVASGEVNASGGGAPGSGTLLACAGVEYSGSSVPAASVPAAQCGGGPVLAYVTLPECACSVPLPCEGPDCPCVGPDCPSPCEGPYCEPSDFCQRGTVQAVLHPLTGRFPGNRGPDVVIDGSNDSIQAAVDAATDLNGDGYTIVGVIASGTGPFALGEGVVRQELTIGAVYARPFALLGCGLTLSDAAICNGQAPVQITASAGSPEHPQGSGVHLYVLDISVGGSQSAPAWLVQGDGRHLEEVEAHGSLGGIRIEGNDNTLVNAVVRDNLAFGVVVQGARNAVRQIDVLHNVGDGVTVSGNRNLVAGSQVGAQGAGNHGDGIRVSGQGNTVRGNLVHGNAGDGITVSGGVAASPNIVRNNHVGAAGQGNIGNGIVVGGTGGGAAAPIEIEGNTARGNVLAGIVVTGTGHQLKNNVSGGPGEGNYGCEYAVGGGNINSTGNTVGTAPISGADGSPFPAGCLEDGY